MAKCGPQSNHDTSMLPHVKMVVVSMTGSGTLEQLLEGVVNQLCTFLFSIFKLICSTKWLRLREWVGVGGGGGGSGPLNHHQYYATNLIAQRLNNYGREEHACLCKSGMIFFFFLNEDD